MCPDRTGCPLGGHAVTDLVEEPLQVPRSELRVAAFQVLGLLTGGVVHFAMAKTIGLR